MANKFIVLSSRKLRGAWLNFSRGHSFFNSWRIILIQKLDHPVPQEVRIQFQRWNQDCKLYRSFKRKHFVFCQHFCMKNTFPVTISATYSSKRSVLLKIIGIINIWVQLQDIGEKVGLLPSFRHNRMFSLSWVHESIDRGKLSIPQEILNYCKWNLRFYYHPSCGKSKNSFSMSVLYDTLLLYQWAVKNFAVNVKLFGKKFLPSRYHLFFGESRLLYSLIN